MSKSSLRPSVNVNPIRGRILGGWGNVHAVILSKPHAGTKTKDITSTTVVVDDALPLKGTEIIQPHPNRINRFQVPPNGDASGFSLMI